MLKFLVCLVLSVVAASVLEDDSGLYNNYHGEYAHSYDNYEPRAYHFDYAVSDPHTGDHKSQWEVKDKAGVVRGGYSLLEPDGTTRIVEYIADDHGFRAVVKKLGTAHHPESIEHHGSPIVHEEVAEPHLETITEEPVYHSYDGQVDNYANVLDAAVQHWQPISYKPVEIPHTEELHGYHQQQEILAPKAEGVYQHNAPQLELVAPHGLNVLTPQAEGIWTGGQTKWEVPQYILEQSKVVPQQQHSYILEQPEQKISVVYAQKEEQPKGWVPQQQHNAWEQSKLVVPQQWEQSKLVVPQQWEQSKLVIPQQWEQAKLEVPKQWDQAKLVVPQQWEQPKIVVQQWEQPKLQLAPQHWEQAKLPEVPQQQQYHWEQPKLQLDVKSYVSPQQVAIHSNGESSGQVIGVTNNPDDDSAYANDGHEEEKKGGWSGEYLGSFSQGVPQYASQESQGSKILPLSYVLKHPILH